MQLLPLEATHRQYLTAREALAIDSDGNEVLVGLTASESITYLFMVDQTLNNDWPNDLTELSRFLAMHDRHTAVLPQSSWIYGAVFGLNGHVAHM